MVNIDNEAQREAAISEEGQPGGGGGGGAQEGGGSHCRFAGEG